MSTNQFNQIYLIPCTIGISKSLPRYNVAITFNEEDDEDKNKNDSISSKLQEAKEHFIEHLNKSISQYLEKNKRQEKSRESEFLKSKNIQTSKKLTTILRSSIPDMNPLKKLDPNHKENEPKIENNTNKGNMERPHSINMDRLRGGDEDHDYKHLHVSDNLKVEPHHQPKSEIIQPNQNQWHKNVGEDIINRYREEAEDGGYKQFNIYQQNKDGEENDEVVEDGGYKQVNFEENNKIEKPESEDIHPNQPQEKNQGEKIEEVEDVGYKQINFEENKQDTKNPKNLPSLTIVTKKNDVDSNTEEPQDGGYKQFNMDEQIKEEEEDEEEHEQEENQEGGYRPLLEEEDNEDSDFEEEIKESLLHSTHNHKNMKIIAKVNKSNENYKSLEDINHLSTSSSTTELILTDSPVPQRKLEDNKAKEVKVSLKKFVDIIHELFSISDKTSNQEIPTITKSVFLDNKILKDVKKEDENLKKMRMRSSSVSSLVVETKKDVDTTTVVPHIFNKPLNTFHTCCSILNSEQKSYEMRLRIFSEISKISNAFLKDSEQYGKIIIREMGLPLEEKTIKPINKGGILGGEKFVVANILFKFAIDKNGLFKGDHSAAMKVAGHELKCLTQVASLGIRGLRYPLMCLLDYLGHRLIAMSVLPISGSGEGSTLVYGTQDGGKNYKFTDPVAMEYAKKIGKKLNLKEHKLSSPLVDHGIYTPADIEIHKGKDNNYYILDFSRLLPCDQINKHKPGSIFYRMFRPEFVSTYSKPLCSDSFSGFLNPSELSSCNNEIKEAHIELNRRILAFSKILSEESLPEMISVDKFQRNLRISNYLIERVHEQGINVRYLGRLRKNCTNDHWAQFILMEMIGRVIKRKANSYFREQLLKRKGNYGIDSCISRLVNYLNLVLGKSVQSEEYWQKGLLVELQSYFEDFFRENEKENFEKTYFSTEKIDRETESFWFKSFVVNKPNAKLFGEHPLRFLFGYLTEHLRIYWSDSCYESFSRHSSLLLCPTPFDFSDVVSLGIGVKHLPIAPYSTGKVKQLKSFESEKEMEYELNHQSLKSFHSALSTNPGSVRILRNIAMSYQNLNQHQEALSYFQRALSKAPLSASTIFKYAIFLDNKYSSQQVELHYIKSIQIKPLKYKYLCTYSDWLLARKKFSQSIILNKLAIKYRKDRYEAYNNLACIYILKKDFNEALKYLKEGLDICKSKQQEALESNLRMGVDFNLAICHFSHNLINVYQSIHKYEKIQKLLPFTSQKKPFRKVYIATTSHYKILEILKLLGEKKAWQIKHFYLHNLHSINEENVSLKDLVKAKAVVAHNKIKADCIVEVSFIQVMDDNKNVVDSFTGSKFNEYGVEKFVKNFVNKKSRVGVYVAFYKNSTDEIFVYEGGIIEGKICSPSKLDNSHGWDSIFVVDGYGKTLSQLSKFKHLLNFRREPYLKIRLNHLSLSQYK